MSPAAGRRAEAATKPAVDAKGERDGSGLVGADRGEVEEQLCFYHWITITGVRQRRSYGVDD
ncbi:MAG: hypothetical protein EXS36_09190 [Pedosphaera sp.]|nr:hypothetical protein [Pedosphaera sp.]